MDDNLAVVWDGVQLDGQDTRALVLLHELGHLTGDLGDDRGSNYGVGYAFNRRILQDCFGKDSQAMTMSIGIMLVSCSIIGLLQASQGSNGNHNPVVTVVTEESKYCLGNARPAILVAEAVQPNTVMLVLRLRVSYRNLAKLPLILPIYHEVSALIIRPTPARSGLRHVVRTTAVRAPSTSCRRT